MPTKEEKRYGYTRLTAEVVFPDSNQSPADVVTITKHQWDCDIEDIAQMVRSLLLGMGFHQESVDRIIIGG